MTTELYSYSKYKGFHLYVEFYEDEQEECLYYEGVAQFNGTTFFCNQRMLTGDSSDLDLMKKIDNDQEGEYL